MRLRRGAWLLGLVLLVACDEGAGDEPESEPGAPMRAALVSTPESIAALPIEIRMSLATRMDEALETQRASASLLEVEALDAAWVVGLHDEERADAGEDALVAVAVEREAPAAHLRTLSMAGDDASIGAAPIELVLADPALFEPPYASALRGRARTAIERLARETGADEVVLAPGMPSALAGDDARIFVNPVWLTLLSELDDHAPVAAISAPLTGPVGHHRTTSEGFGCYESCTPRSCGPSTCHYCGFDCGECACECGPESEGVHCASADRRAPSEGAPLDVFWLLVPVAYLLSRRRRG